MASHKAAKGILCSLLIASSTSIAFGQSSAPAVSKAEFRAEVQKEIKSYKHGDFLYRKSDVFQRIIDQRVATRMGLAKEPDRALSTPLDAEESSSILDISKTSSDENETTIAINRVNPKIMVAAGNDDAMYTRSMPAYLTTDAGRSWKTYRLPAVKAYGMLSGGDPMIVCDDKGMFYYAYLIYTDPNSGGGSISDLVVAHSSDGKVWTLGKPVVGNKTAAAIFEDKETIAVDMDPASPHYGRLYIAWVHYDEQSGFAAQRVAYSDDKGTSWSSPFEISTEFGYFPLLRVGKGGTVFLSTSTSGDVAEGIHTMFVSHDGGEVYEQRDIAPFVDYPTNNNGRSGLKGDAGFRSFPYATFDIDLQSNKLYCTYGTYDDSYASLYTTTSTDEGKSWSTAVQVGSGDGLDRFLPWVSVDQEKHKVFASYYSSEEDQNNSAARFVRSDFDSVSVSRKLGTNLFDPLAVMNQVGDAFLGDYIGSDVYNGYFAAAWTENRPLHSDGEIFAYVSSPETPSGVVQINKHEFKVSAPMPNPIVGNVVRFSIETSEQSEVSISLYDAQGKQVASKRATISPESVSDLSLELSQLPSGAYHARISDGVETVEREVTVLH